MIAWERALIRNGFIFVKIGLEFSFHAESEPNRVFFSSVLAHMHLHETWNAPVFSPPTEEVDECKWLNAVEKTRPGAEGGEPQDLQIMDTYMAGLVRWTNNIGIGTHYSCDGHDSGPCTMNLSNKNQSYIFNVCLHILSRGKWRFSKGRLKCRRLQLSDRYWLLDAAEALFNSREELRVLVENAERIQAASGARAAEGCARQ